MRIFFITLSLVGLLLVSPSCKKTAPATDIEVDTALVEDDDLDLDDLGLDDLDTDSLSTDTVTKTDKAPTTTDKKTSTPDNNPKKVTAKGDVKTANPAQAGRLMKYNVVISTLSQESGVKRLSSSLDKAGISYFVVRTGGLYMFVVESSDSLESAIKARKDFLLKTTVDKSRQQIWKDFEIEITDTYILEKR